MKLVSGFLLFFAAVGYLSAQDMPPLPPLPDQTASAPSTDANSASPALPPLPDQQAAPADNSGNALPPLPDQNAPATGSTSPPQASPAQAASADNSGAALPPLPGQQAAPAGNSGALPPIPGQEAAPAAASTEAAPATMAPGGMKPAKKAAAQPWWTKTKARPNVIFGGWVKPKGGNESSRLAWASQEVLNALLFKGYKVVKEDGKYDGQEGAGGHQWREFTFSVPKSKLTTQVYVRQVGRKVWLRVGPSEPPAFANHSIAQVEKMRETNLRALHLVQRKLGRRLSPHHIIRSFEAPYSYAKEAVVE